MNNRMSYNVWRPIKNIFENPYNESFIERLKDVSNMMSNYKDSLFWKDNFSYIYRLICIIKGHTYYHVLHENHTYNGKNCHPIFCVDCYKKHEDVRLTCKLKKKRNFFLKKVV